MRVLVGILFFGSFFLPFMTPDHPEVMFVGILLASAVARFRGNVPDYGPYNTPR